MRVVPAAGQYFGFRVLLEEGVDLTMDTLGGIFTVNAEYDRTTLKDWCSQIHEHFGGEAYGENEAKKLKQRWCFEDTSILQERVYYFGFTNEEDALWFMMKFGKKKKKK
jgi:hypothetical protein